MISHFCLCSLFLTLLQMYPQGNQYRKELLSFLGSTKLSSTCWQLYLKYNCQDLSHRCCKYMFWPYQLYILSCFIVCLNEVRLGLSNVKKFSCKQDHRQKFDTWSSCRFPHFCLICIQAALQSVSLVCNKPNNVGMINSESAWFCSHLWQTVNKN